MFPIWHGSLFNVALVDAVAHFVVVVLVVSVVNVAVLLLLLNMLLFFLNSFNGWLSRIKDFWKKLRLTSSSGHSKIFIAIENYQIIKFCK